MTDRFAEASALFWQSLEMRPLTQFFHQFKLPQSEWPGICTVKKNELPEPYDFLLTQPVMTVGVAQYYQRTPKVRQPLYALEDNQKIYSRAIVMILDNNLKRDDALLADRLQQSTVVELGLININTALLPLSLLDEIKRGNTPFGALLAPYQIKAHESHQYYFEIQNNPLLQKYLGSHRQTWYGRTNKLLNEQNITVADVVEILSLLNPV